MSAEISISGRPRIQQGRAGRAAGFTMIELLIAILLLLVGISAVAQLIPAAMNRNFLNRYDSTALILAQRQLELMSNQRMNAGDPPVGSNFFFNTTLPDGTAIVVNLGIHRPPGPSDFGAPVTTDPAGNLLIDWRQPTSVVPVNYINQYRSAEGYLYETRWRVMTFYQTLYGVSQPVAKRILLSTRGGPEGAAQPPTTLVTMVSARP